MHQNCSDSKLSHASQSSNLAMSQSLQRSLKFFYFTGMAIKSFSSGRNFSGNFISFWSVAMLIIHLFAITLLLFGYEIKPENLHIILLQVFGILTASLSYFAVFLFIILQRNNEKKFWELLNQVEMILTNFSCVPWFNRMISFKIGFWMIIFVFNQMFSFIAAIIRGDRRVAIVSVVVFIPRSIYWIFAMKFVFYVDVLSFILKNIHLKLSRKQLTVDDLRDFRKSYSLCWRMSRLIDDIFGWGLVCTSMGTLVASLQAGYLFSSDLAKGNLYFIPLVQIFSILLRIWVIVSSCQKCINRSSAIITTLFSINSRDFHPSVEGLGLQILHQRILFEPKNAFVIDHANFICVSYILVRK